MNNRRLLPVSWSRKNCSLFGAIAIGATMIVLPGCGTTDTEEIQEDRTNVTTEDVSEAVETEDFQSLIGQEVTLRNPVEEYVGETGFVLQTEDEPILVINATGVPFSVPSEDTAVQVTGEVAQFVQVDVENEFGLDLDDTAYVDYEEQPAIIAESLALAPTPEEVAENPDVFMDQVIAIQGDIRDITSSNTFTLFEEGWIDDYGILVVGSSNLKSDSSAIQTGETITATGTLQPFDADALQQDYNLDLTADQLNEFSERYNRPVLVADEVYSSAVDK